MSGVNIVKHQYTVKVIRMTEEYYKVEGVDVRDAIDKFNPSDVPADWSDTGWLEVVEITKQYAGEGI